MHRIIKRIPALHTLFVFVFTATLSTAIQAQSIPISPIEDFKNALANTPCKDDDARKEGVKELFRSAGAAAEDVTTQKFEKIENVVVTKPGKTKETVIVGAHYDKTIDGCGVIDNWTGIAIITNLYKTIRGLDTKKTFVFAAFASEEKGLLGSAAMAENMPKEERANVCAMVNFDSFGFAYPQALGNVSDGPLIKLAASVSKEMKVGFANAEIGTASTDSASFRAKKIPSISLHGLDNRWRNFLHSNSDTIKNVNMESVYFAYRHALVMLAKIENSPCDAFRK